MGTLRVAACALLSLAGCNSRLPPPLTPAPATLAERAVYIVPLTCEGCATIDNKLRIAASKAGLTLVADRSAPHDIELDVQVAWGVHTSFTTTIRDTRGKVLDIASDDFSTWDFSNPNVMIDCAAPTLINHLTESRKAAALPPSQPDVRAASTPAAAPPPEKPATSTPAAFVAASPQPASYAVIFGIEKYRDVATEATGARGDAKRFGELMAQSLGLPADHVIVGVDDRATLSDINKQLDWLKNTVPEGGRIYFFFSGHGAPDASAGTPYLLPYDGDPKYLERTALPLAAVMKALGETRAKEVLAIFDSCFSGSGGRSVLPPGARPLVRVAGAVPAAKLAVFSAASGSEISGPAPGGGNGLFSKFVIDALGSGAADQNGDGQVSLQELSDWVSPRVAREAKKDNRDQNPSLQLGSSAGTAGNFIVTYGLKTR